MKSRFTDAINWNKYQSKVTKENLNQYLDYLIDPSFQGVNRLFVLSLENNVHQIRQKRHFLSKVEIKDYNVMADGQNFFDQPVKNDLRTYDNVRKITIGQEDDYWTGCLF